MFKLAASRGSRSASVAATVVATVVTTAAPGRAARFAAQPRSLQRMGVWMSAAVVASALVLSAGCGSSDGGSAAPAVVKDTAALTPGLALSSIAVFQAVRVPVVKDGAREATKYPIVAGRPGVIRVYVSPDETFVAREVTAVLKLTTGGVALPAISVVRNVTQPSSDNVPASCFDFNVEGAALAEDTTFSIDLTSTELPRVALTAVPAESSARYPQAAAPEALGATAASGTLKVVLVPVVYNADGSGRTPDTSEEALEVFGKDMRELYPAATLDLTVHEPFAWAGVIGGNGGGWDRILNAIVNLRAKDKVADDVYYYGMFMPTASVGSFCQQGCVLGLSGLAQDPRDPSIRASIGIGYPGKQSGGTMAHEVGHAHGRPHAPCGGAQGVDRNFPYAQAAIGTLGYSVVTQKFLPSTYKDMMSYCDPAWISDYNYGKLFERIALVNSAAQAKRFTPASAYEPFRLASVDGAGRISVNSEPVLRVVDTQDRKPLTLRLARNVRKQAELKFVPYDHLPGGMLFLPANADDAALEGAVLEGVDLQAGQRAFHED